MLSDDTNSLRHLSRRSSKNCDLQFANTDRFKENYSIDKHNIVNGRKPKLTVKNNKNTLPFLENKYLTKELVSAGVSCGKLFCHSLDIVDSVAKEIKPLRA